jgi:hypothetical protein
MAARFNPPPSWPQPPQGWQPPPGWHPDPAWGPPPPGWSLWLDDDEPATPQPAPLPPGTVRPAWDAVAPPEQGEAEAEPAPRPRSVRRRVLAGVGALVVLAGAVVAVQVLGDDQGSSSAARDASTTEDDGSVVDAARDAALPGEDGGAQEAFPGDGAAGEGGSGETGDGASTTDGPDAGDQAGDAAASQQHAYESAGRYLDLMAFSRAGLTEHLVYEGFSVEDAEAAIARMEGEARVDWNAQAVAKAAGHLESIPFTRDELVEQLVLEGFTPEQAEYGVSALGL